MKTYQPGFYALKVSDLQPHPKNTEIYGDPRDSQDFPAFVDECRSHGIHPLIVAEDLTIIGGHRRYYAALDMALDTVEVVVKSYPNDLEKLAALLTDNYHRIKTNWQLANEAESLMGIERERAKARQGARTDLDNIKQPVAESYQEHGQARNKVGEHLGISHATVDNLLTVKRAIDSAERNGTPEKAAQLKADVNKNIRKTAEAVREEKRQTLTLTPPIPEKAKAEIISVSQWNAATPAEHNQWLQLHHEIATTFNKTTENVEWARWTWNPVTGCLHNCAYCYARDIAQRRYTSLPDGDRFTPVFYPDRLSAPCKTAVPQTDHIDDPIDRMGLHNVFVCSMADLFGKWVPTAWIEAVLHEVHANPQWTFLFLTKFPQRLAEFAYPRNTWIGTTVDTQAAVTRAEKAFQKVRDGGYQGIAWLSCEPLMEDVTFASLGMFDWVVMGGASKSNQTPEFRPPFAWIVHLWNQAKAVGLPVYMKTNLFLSDAHKSIPIPSRVREYPRMADNQF